MIPGLNVINVSLINSLPGETIPLNVTSVTSSVTWALPASAKNGEMLVSSIGPSTCFIATGVGSATAVVPSTSGTVGATPILPNAIYTLQKNTNGKNIDTVAAICSGSGTCTVYFTSVQGS